MKKLEKMVKLQREFAKLYSSEGLIAVSDDSVHLTDTFFLETFTHYVTLNFDDKHDKLETKFDDVVVFCLQERRK